MIDNKPWIYDEFLKTFQTRGYDFVFFNELPGKDGKIALRHDIDFDTTFALQCAETEFSLGIRSTFFFLLRSEFYNIFSGTDYNNIVKIRSLGHKISIHFDPTIYEDFHKGLEKELQVFKTIFDEDVHIISIHRPNAFFQQLDEPIFDIEHTYQSKYFRDIKYFADSTGVWRYGNPVDSVEFANKQNLHVLIHPIWWMINGAGNTDKLKNYFALRIKQLNQQFYLNCIPFQQIHDQV